MTLIEQAIEIRDATYRMMTLPITVRDAALIAMADALLANARFILDENEKDMQLARENGKSTALLDRLLLTNERIEGMANGLRKIAALPDPVGGEDYVSRRPNGIMIGKRRVPLGAIGIIYEARPNVTSDAAGLCVKSANAVLLRGGSEVISSNIAIVDVIAKAAYEVGLPKGSIQLLRNTSRESALEMMRLDGYLDVLIPRGGTQLIQSVVQNATVPVIETGNGNCHTYVHGKADAKKAQGIVLNAKASRPAVCNATETLLIDESALGMLPAIAAPLLEKGVELRGCEKALSALPSIKQASEEDWATEYHDYILAIRVVQDIDEAIAHINRYGTRHSECIVTEDYSAAEKFLNEVDAAVVYANASTRFTDGEEFGFGAEIGISTQKLHARGPMGLHELTTVKYIVRGDGQIR